MVQEPDGIDCHYAHNLGPDRLDDFLPRVKAVTNSIRDRLWPTADAEGVIGRIG